MSTGRSEPSPSRTGPVALFWSWPRVSGFRAHLRRRQSGILGAHHDARRFKPRGPDQPSGSGPKRKRVRRLNKLAECVERGLRLQDDRNLFGVTAWRPSMKDLNVQSGQMHGCPCFDNRVLRCGSFELAQGYLPLGSNTEAIARRPAKDTHSIGSIMRSQATLGAAR